MWATESLQRASPMMLGDQARVDRYLTAMASLTDEEWRIIYVRYLADQRRIDQSEPRFGGASIDAIVRRQRVESKEESAAATELSRQASARVKEIALNKNGETAPEEGTVSFQVRIGWIMQRIVVMMWSLDRIVTVPKRLAAARYFLTLFDGFIEFPELQ